MESNQPSMQDITTKLASIKQANANTAKQIDELIESINPATTPQPATIEITAMTGTEDSLEISWKPIPGAHHYSVARNGSDRNGHGPWTDETDQTKYKFEKLLADTQYTIAINAIDKSGKTLTTKRITLPTAPTKTLPPPANPTTNGFRRVNRSGLKADSIVFLGGDPDLEAIQKFASDRGRPFDGALTFPARGSWQQIIDSLPAAKRAVDAGYRVVYSIPHAPTSEGDQMNQRGANDAYRNEQRNFGSALKTMGLNSDLFVLRVDWEFNGDWYNWSANRPGGPAGLKQALDNFRRNVRATAGSGNLFDLCCNKLPSQSRVTWSDVMPDEPYDVIGIDQYDMWQPSFTQADWDNEIRKGIALADEQAIRFGIRWSLDETGNTHPKDGNHGGDNPTFWRLLTAEISKRADRCAWWNTYEHDGAPDTLHHQLRVHNPQSWSEYKTDLGKNLS